MSVIPGTAAPGAGLSAHGQALWRSAAELRRRADESARLVASRAAQPGEVR